MKLRKKTNPRRAGTNRSKKGPRLKFDKQPYKGRIMVAQLNAIRHVNRELIDLYFELGEMIVKKQGEMGWGKSVVESLASDLQKSLPGVGGFSASNLWRMRTFFNEYHDNTNLAQLVREIGWSHNIAIFQKCKNPQEREFYLAMTKKTWLVGRISQSSD